jgi:phosphoglycerate dehydrogenase-like enzyme
MSVVHLQPISASSDMRPVLSFPVLEGMTYPQLESANVVRCVKDEAELLSLPAAARASVRVLMTSASRGCSAAVAEALPSLSLVVSQGAGQDRIDIPALAARGVRVRSISEALTEDVADLAMALAQMCSRRLVRADAFARSSAWRSRRFEVGYGLTSATMGIAGLSGRIGQALARRAQAACMKIAGLRRRSNDRFGVPLHDDMRSLAEASDVLVLAVPGLPELRHMVGAAELRALGPTGRLVNVGRGDLVDTEALIAALEKGEVFGAGLDVLEGEPAVPRRLAELPNVVLTPHIGGATWGARMRAARIAEEEVVEALGWGTKNRKRQEGEAQDGKVV